MGYVVYGLARTVFFGLLGRLPHGEFYDQDDPLLDDDGLAQDGEGRLRRRRRRRRPLPEREPAPTRTSEEPRA